MHSCWLPPYYGSYCLTFQPLPARKAAGLHTSYCSGNILWVWIYTYLMLCEYTGAEHNSVICLKHCWIDVWPWWNYNSCWLAVKVCDNLKTLLVHVWTTTYACLEFIWFESYIFLVWKGSEILLLGFYLLTKSDTLAAMNLQLYSRIFSWELSPLFAQKDNSYLKQGSLHKFQMNNYTEYDLVDDCN